LANTHLDLRRQALEGLSGSYIHLKEYDRALPVANENVQVIEKLYGPRSVEYGWALLSVSDIQRRKSNDTSTVPGQASKEIIAIFREALLSQISKGIEPGSVTSKSGESLPILAWWNSDKAPQAVVLCVHGLGLHNASYAEFGKRMASKGYL